MQTLITWLGNHDIETAILNKDAAVSQSLKEINFGKAVILYNFPSINFDKYISHLESDRMGYENKINLLKQNLNNEFPDYKSWLQSRTNTKLNFVKVNLSSPTDHSDIYKACLTELDKIHKENPDTKLTYLISPGTPAMHAVWLILSQTKYAGELIETSLEAGLKKIKLPFEISADYNPSLSKIIESSFKGLSLEDFYRDAVFENIFFQSKQMQSVFNKAVKVSQFDEPVLITGATGTGKEEIANIIYKKSRRKDNTFKTLNCGAIPQELVESELFGHKKGSFTGADKDKKGLFEVCDNGTLFLDEFGELPLRTQVKLLRVLQDGSFTPIGSTEEIKTNVRLIAATNRNLIEEIKKGKFREDLFYRIAVFTIDIPSLRERQGDLKFLINKFIEKIKKENAQFPEVQERELSVSGMTELLNHSWPGNVRELFNTLKKLLLLSDSKKISAEEVKKNLNQLDKSDKENLLLNYIPSDFNFDYVIGKIVKHYYSLAQKHTNKKTEISKLLGFKNYQTMENWINKYLN